VITNVAYRLLKRIPIRQPSGGTIVANFNVDDRCAVLRNRIGECDNGLAKVAGINTRGLALCKVVPEIG